MRAQILFDVFLKNISQPNEIYTPPQKNNQHSPLGSKISFSLFLKHKKLLNRARQRRGGGWRCRMPSNAEFCVAVFLELHLGIVFNYPLWYVTSIVFLSILDNVNVNYIVFFAYFANVSKHGNYLFFKRCQVKKNECTTQEQNKMETDLRGESLLMSTRRCQDANSTAIYGLS